MSNRTTRKELDEAFADFVRMLGAQVGYKKGNFYLNHSPNGYRVVLVTNDSGGIRHTFGDRRYAAGELLTMLFFAIHAMAIAHDNRGDQHSADSERILGLVHTSLQSEYNKRKWWPDVSRAISQYWRIATQAQA